MKRYNGILRNPPEADTRVRRPLEARLPARIACAVALLTPMTAFPATETELAELRTMIDQMKSQYERRIQDLESRLAKAERDAAKAATRSEEAADRAEKAAEVAATESRPMTAPVVTPTASPESGKTVLGALGSGNAFNPQISVFLDGNYYHDGIDGEGATLVGLAYQPSGGESHSHEEDDGDEGHAGHMHGLTENGFNFREAEIAFSATVDPYFDASLFLAIDGDGTVELEEGYFQTRSLPAGLRVKGGKFLSDFGYINRQHPHQWDFVDQNLAYLNLLGPHGLQDTGLQLTWLPKLPFYTLLGVEGLQGNQEIFGATLGDDDQAALELGDTDDGPRLWTAFAKVSPEIGVNHALQLGLSYANNNQHQEAREHSLEQDGDHEDTHDEDHATEIHRDGLAGDAQLWGVDLVYKYDGGGAYGHKSFKLQSEYLRSIKDMKTTSSAHPEVLGTRRTFTTDGLYAQAIYGFAPKWTAGLRYDVLGMTNEVSGGENASFGSSDRWTFDVTWNLSEFSRLRAQYAHNDILVAPGERERFDAFYLQFLVSMGSHGAHAF
ncbi:TonB-dependent receptor [Thiocapsa marina]|uniref:Phosphate-selective porin O and P n=1 Tax=Thiocapsa marina 5811 TaxID=768671 RepID=F9UHB2_9GAMM|nr:TonB-dependent receptor [Thiocapsa marina]EGV16370.1 phosphate-selective porin O and P [Thiocapsa marina 5811]